MIGEVARQKGLIVIEDAIYSFLKEKPLAPIASYAPEKVIYIASVSKPSHLAYDYPISLHRQRYENNGNTV